MPSSGWRLAFPWTLRRNPGTGGCGVRRRSMLFVDDPRPLPQVWFFVSILVAFASVIAAIWITVRPLWTQTVPSMCPPPQPTGCPVAPEGEESYHWRSYCLQRSKERKKQGETMGDHRKKNELFRVRPPLPPTPRHSPRVLLRPPPLPPPAGRGGEPPGQGLVRRHPHPPVHRPPPVVRPPYPQPPGTKTQPTSCALLLRHPFPHDPPRSSRSSARPLPARSSSYPCPANPLRGRTPLRSPFAPGLPPNLRHPAKSPN